MKRTRLLAVRALAGAAFAVATSSAAFALEVISAPEPPFPPALTNEPINAGAAYIAATVDDEGTVLETFTLQTTHPAFAATADETLRSWRYTSASPAETAAPTAPASDRAAESAPAAWPRFEIVRFIFNRTGTLTNHTNRETVRLLYPRDKPNAFELAELPLVPAHQLRRVAGLPPRTPPGAPAGEVIVEFLIDREGRARVPIALQAPDRALARAAVAAVREWRFAPPDDTTAPAIRTRWLFRFRAQPAPAP